MANGDIFGKNDNAYKALLNGIDEAIELIN